MRRAFWRKPLLMVPTLLLGGWLVVVANEWLPLISAEQRHQLEVLAQLRTPPPGSNGFAEIWTLQYEVPPDELADVIAHDHRAITATENWHERPDSLYGSNKYPSRVDVSPSELCCKPDHMLDEVETGRSKLQQFVKQHAQLFNALRRLERHDYFWDPLPMRSWSSYYSLQLLRFRSMEIALGFSENPSRSVEQLCDHIDFLRRLRLTNNLIFDNIGVVFGKYNLQLLADMRSRVKLPTEPASCAVALRGLTDKELDECAEIQVHFAHFVATSEAVARNISQDEKVSFGRALVRSIGPLLINNQHTAARMAARHFPFCTSDNNRDPSLGTFTVEACAWTESLFNPIGCYVSGVEYDFNHYQRDRLDLDSDLRLFAIANWLAAQPEPTPKTLRQLPERLSIRGVEVQFDPTQRMLRARNYSSDRSEWWGIPLPLVAWEAIETAPR